MAGVNTEAVKSLDFIVKAVLWVNLHVLLLKFTCFWDILYTLFLDKIAARTSHHYGNGHFKQCVFLPTPQD